jgi:hypothetical protein
LGDSLDGTPLQEPLQWSQANKMAGGGIAWFFGSSFSASLLKTGAFEVTVRADDDSITVWSGIARGGRPPQTMNEMNDIIDALRSVGVGSSAPTTDSPNDF